MALHRISAKKRLLGVSPAVLAWCLIMGSGSAAFADANAQSAAPDSDSIETVVVTANKRLENLQDVGASAQAFSAQDIQSLHVTNTTQVANLTPGVQVISPNSNSDNFFSIRGVSQNDFSEHQESPVAVYFDQAYMSQAAGTAGLLFDTERVEVLRGPQGTLFGRNATGGVVEYFSKPPTDVLDGYATLGYGSYNHVRLEGAIGGPVSDTVDMRLSLAAHYGDPVIRNNTHPNKSPFNANSQAGRFQVLWTPRQDLSFRLITRAAREDIRSGFYNELASYQDPTDHLLGRAVPPNVDIFGTCAGCDLAGYKNTNPFYTSEAGFVGHNKNSTYGATLISKYSFGGLNLTSITDYSHFNKNYAEDSPSSPIDEVHYFTFTNVSQESQEVRLDNGANSRFRWVAGFYYLHISGHYREGVTIGPVFGGPVAFNDPYRLETTSYAPFAQAEYDILHNLTLIVGGRWSQEEKTFDFASSIVGSENLNDPALVTYNFNPALYGNLAKLSRGDWSARVGLNWHVTKNIMPYISWNRGIKAGGFNAPLTGFNPGGGPSVDPASFKFGEERISAFETGIKSEFWNHRARVNADVFYYDYADYQAFNFKGLTQIVFNTPGKISGGEIQTTFLPFQGFTINLGAAFLDATADAVPLPDGTSLNRRMVQAPKFSFLGRLQYVFEPSFGGAATIETDFNWRTGVYYSISNAPSTYQPGYWLQNFHLSYTLPNGKWRVGAYVENAFDQHYYNNMIDVSSLGFTQRVYGMRRMYGFTINYQL